MPVPESPKHRELRKSLRALTSHVAGLKEHEFDLNQGRIHNISILPMDLDKNFNFNPTFFAPCPASLLLEPDDSYDQRAPPGFYEFEPNNTICSRPIDCARNMLDYFTHYTCNCALFSKDQALNGPWSSISLGDKPFPFAGLHCHTFPEFAAIHAYQVKEGPHPHVKARIYNNLNGIDGTVLRGEVITALHLMIGQMRRARFIDHMTAPVLLFSFMGPQHVRLVEAYFDGSSVVVRPSRLFDLRKKDEAVIKQLGQWHFGEPIGNTKECP